MKGIISRVSIESGPIYWGFMQPGPRKKMEDLGVEYMNYIGVQDIKELRRKDHPAGSLCRPKDIINPIVISQKLN